MLLAVMSSSRSDVVTQSVCPFVSPFVPFFLFVSFKFFLILKSFNGVSRNFQWGLQSQGYFKEVLRVFRESVKGDSRIFKGCFKEI